mmetsp:Transcript_25487/g.74858  ORF Transcript_25487/g.74858 Transcript_25487/m.74858 type:complete len:251 (-) Transcript_25487:84-836(-)
MSGQGFMGSRHCLDLDLMFRVSVPEHCEARRGQSRVAPLRASVALCRKVLIECRRLLLRDGAGEVHVAVRDEVTELGGEVVQRHALALDGDLVTGLGDTALGADGHHVTVEVHQLLFKTEQALPQAQVQVDVQVLALPAEARVALGSDCEHHVTGHLLGLLLAHALEDDLMPRVHAALDDRVQGRLLLGALLPRRDFLLLLHNHARAHLPVHRSNLVGAFAALGAPRLALRRIRAPAAAADDAPLDLDAD